MKVKVLVDPLGNEVHLPSHINNICLEIESIDNDLSPTIVKPAMVIKPTDSLTDLYHFRSIFWGKTILLRSEWKGEFWMVTECIKNPAFKIVFELMKKGRPFSIDCNGEIRA